MNITPLLMSLALGPAALSSAPEGGASEPILPYLENPSVVYRECVSGAAYGQSAPSVAVIGQGPCRQARSALLTSVRYYQAVRWSSFATDRAQARRIAAQIDRSAANIVEDYETELQRWLETRPAASESPNADN